MSNGDTADDWMSSQAAQAVLRRSDRQIRTYAQRGELRTRRRGPGGRVEYYGPDVRALAARLDVERDPARVEVAEIVPAVQLQAQVERLYAQLREAEARAVQAETALRMLPDPAQARQLEAVAAQARAEAEGLRAQLAAAEGAGRAWQRIALLLALVVLLAVAAVVALALLR